MHQVIPQNVQQAISQQSSQKSTEQVKYLNILSQLKKIFIL